MRLIGYILLFGGFAAITLTGLHAREYRYAVVSQELQQLSLRQDSYAGEDVRQALSRAVSTSWDHIYIISFFSGIAMLAGGVLLGASGVRKSKS